MLICFIRHTLSVLPITEHFHIKQNLYLIKTLFELVSYKTHKSHPHTIPCMCLWIHVKRITVRLECQRI